MTRFFGFPTEGQKNIIEMNLIVTVDTPDIKIYGFLLKLHLPLNLPALWMAWLTDFRRARRAL